MGIDVLPADVVQIAAAKPTHRSAVTNGSELLPGIDGRSAWARRLRDVIANHVADLGGDQAISEAERSIVRRAATMTVELERLEARFATAGAAAAPDLDLYQRTAGNLRRLLESVGIGRRPARAPQGVDAYLATKGRKT